MRGPDLTTTEVMAYLRRRIERYERLGLSREDAIRAISLDDEKFNEAKIASFFKRFDKAPT